MDKEKEYYIEVKNDDHQDLIYSFLESKGCLSRRFDKSRKVDYFAFSKRLFIEGRFFFGLSIGGERCYDPSINALINRQEINSIEEMIELFQEFEKVTKLELDGLTAEKTERGELLLKNEANGDKMYLSPESVKKINELINGPV